MTESNKNNNNTMEEEFKNFINTSNFNWTDTETSFMIVRTCIWEAGNVEPTIEKPLFATISEENYNKFKECKYIHWTGDWNDTRYEYEVAQIKRE